MPSRKCSGPGRAGRAMLSGDFEATFNELQWFELFQLEKVSRILESFCNNSDHDAEMCLINLSN